MALRNISAILLCGIFFFNWVGYRLLDNIMEEDATRRLDARLDQQQYDGDQLFTIKAPVTDLAYYNSSARFERANGQIEINGVPYRYVKRRIYNDSLEILCIPNKVALQLRQVRGNYFNLVTGIDRPQDPGTHPGAHRSFSSDPFVCIGTIQIPGPACKDMQPGYPFSTTLSSLSLPTDERPPASQRA